MSVLSLSPNTITVWSATTGVSEFGDPTYTWDQAYRSIHARIVYRSGGETVSDGKEMVVPTHEIFVHQKYTIDETMRITDESGHVYDIVNVNRLYGGTHMQIYARMVDQIEAFVTADWESSSSSSESSVSSSSQSLSSSTT